mmetsp:Transcript_154234/g.284018  ORF Transcript_154234/g.284018 Transcript_154234/m.284018 type:complete len:252 (-) Transcript_154234:426-1181(-)
MVIPVVLPIVATTIIPAISTPITAATVPTGILPRAIRTFVLPTTATIASAATSATIASAAASPASAATAIPAVVTLITIPSPLHPDRVLSIRPDLVNIMKSSDGVLARIAVFIEDKSCSVSALVFGIQHVDKIYFSIGLKDLSHLLLGDVVRKVANEEFIVLLIFLLFFFAPSDTDGCLSIAANLVNAIQHLDGIVPRILRIVEDKCGSQSGCGMGPHDVDVVHCAICAEDVAQLTLANVFWKAPNKDFIP